MPLWGFSSVLGGLARGDGACWRDSPGAAGYWAVFQLYALPGHAQPCRAWALLGAVGQVLQEGAI